MTTPALYLTVVNSRIRFSLDVEHSPGTAVNSCERMIHQDVISGIIHGEFNHYSTACRNQCGLQTHRRGTHQIAFAIYTVKYFANDVKARNEIDSAVAYIHTNRIADVRGHALGECSGPSVENDILGFPIEIILCVEKLKTFSA